MNMFNLTSKKKHTTEFCGVTKRLEVGGCWSDEESNNVSATPLLAPWSCLVVFLHTGASWSKVAAASPDLIFTLKSE